MELFASHNELELVQNKLSPAPLNHSGGCGGDTRTAHLPKTILNRIRATLEDTTSNKSPLAFRWWVVASSRMDLIYQLYMYYTKQGVPLNRLMNTC